MGKWIRAFFWLITGLCFAYDLYLWGGLAITPTVGKQLRDVALTRAPLAATYLVLGRQLVNAAGLSDEALDFAAKRFSKQIADTESSPLLVVERFKSAQSAWATLVYYAAPILLLLSLVLHVRRQKQIRSFGGKG